MKIFKNLKAYLSIFRITFKMVKVMHSSETKTLFFICSTSSLDGYIENLPGTHIVDCETNFTKYELHKFIKRFPVADDNELILMKAEHEAINEGFIQ